MLPKEAEEAVMEVINNPPPKVKLIRTSDNCSMCDDKLPEGTETVKRYSGLVNYIERICPACSKQIGGTSRIVCLDCRHLKAYIKPQHAKTGFLFSPDTCYHVSSCPRCNPNATHSHVLEHVRYVMERGGEKIEDKKTIDSIKREHKKVDDEARVLKEHFKPNKT